MEIFNQFTSIAAILTLSLLLTVAIIIVIMGKRRSGKKTPGPQLPIKQSSGYTHLSRSDDPVPFNQDSWLSRDQSAEWLAAMTRVGTTYQQAGITHIILVHGTFTGTDPFGLVGILKAIYPQLSRQVEGWLKKGVKASTDQLMGNVGNFTEEYAQLLGTSLRQNAIIDRFHWSSENHHAARWNAALGLIEKLVKIKRDHPSSCQNFLLIGHSHAGQIFATMEHLIQKDSLLHKQLWQLAGEEHRSQWEATLTHLHDCQRFFATLGMPPRYPWPESSTNRAIHIVNHRDPSLQAERFEGILTTQGGDYIQRLALDGSDIVPHKRKERDLCQQLSQIFGPSANLNHLRMLTKTSTRPLGAGFSYLIDFEDQNAIKPNFWKTIFGHGVYTQPEHMKFIHEIIAKHFFEEPKD